MRNYANRPIDQQTHEPPSRMLNDQIADLTQPQRDRLAFVELRVNFIGEIRRQDLVSRFGIQSAAATRDLALYKVIAPGNIDYDSKGKSYVTGNNFQPVFDFPPERVMAWLSQGFGDGEPTKLKAWIASDIPSRLSQPGVGNTRICDPGDPPAMPSECPVPLHFQWPV